jgi:hypothetical protein
MRALTDNPTQVTVQLAVAVVIDQVGNSRSSKVRVKAVRAGFQRYVQRCAPLPVGG